MRLWALTGLAACVSLVSACGRSPSRPGSGQKRGTGGLPQQETGLFTTGSEFLPFRKSRITVARSQLNKAVPPHDVYFYVQTSCDKAERKLTLIITVGRPSTWHTGVSKSLPGQILPYMCYWQVRVGQSQVLRQWEPHFENRTRSGPGDTFYTTIFSLPPKELRQSHLLVYFEDVDGDGKREDVLFDLDMRDYDWRPTAGLVLDKPRHQ